jgi:hypothetical protein
MAPNDREVRPDPTVRSVATGAALGLSIAAPAVFAAIVSAGAGHGDYAAARALFPVPMLSTLPEGRIGATAIALALVQFPLYGAAIGWARARRACLPAALAGFLHLAAAIACFGGALPAFS